MYSQQHAVRIGRLCRRHVFNTQVFQATYSAFKVRLCRQHVFNTQVFQAPYSAFKVRLCHQHVFNMQVFQAQYRAFKVRLCRQHVFNMQVFQAPYRAFKVRLCRQDVFNTQVLQAPYRAFKMIPRNLAQRSRILSFHDIDSKILKPESQIECVNCKGHISQALLVYWSRSGMPTHSEWSSCDETMGNKKKLRLHF